MKPKIKMNWMVKLPSIIKPDLDKLILERAQVKKIPPKDISYGRLMLAMMRNTKRNKPFYDDLINADFVEEK